MCVMFALMTVFWVVLALPTIDQHLYTIFCFLCQYCTLSTAQPTLNKEQGSQQPAATHHQASVLQIQEDGDTSDGEGEGGTAKKPRLNGSQELKKSEEGESIEEVVQRQEGEGAAASVETSKPKTKPKRRVRFSDADQTLISA